MQDHSTNAREAKRGGRLTSWHVPALLAVGLLAGIAVGLFAGPYLTAHPPVQESASPAPAAVSPTTAPVPTTAEDTARANLMSTVVGATRHFRGAAEAPVTVVEFGDFQ